MMVVLLKFAVIAAKAGNKERLEALFIPALV